MINKHAGSKGPRFEPGSDAAREKRTFGKRSHGNWIPCLARFLKRAPPMERGEVPVGAVIVRDGKIISVAGNQNSASQESDAHAEILAIQQGAARGVRKTLRCDIYVTLSLAPCALRRFPSRVCADSISPRSIQRAAG